MLSPVDEAADAAIRNAAFLFLERLVSVHGDVLPWDLLRAGFDHEGRTIRLIDYRGIVIPPGMDAPLAVTTSWRDPYGDEVSADGLIHYHYFGDDPSHRDNVGLRDPHRRQVPLIYGRGVAKSEYVPVWPVYVATDDPGARLVTLAAGDPLGLTNDLPSALSDAARRYRPQSVLQRLHQAKFRREVIVAYDTTCAICRLRHRELLDAAHILPDRDPRSLPVVPNGLALCKLHHAAFDRNILGVRPDHVIEIRLDILSEEDGPMLEHGLQGHHEGQLITPRRPLDHPNSEFLEERYEIFRQAS